MEEYEVIRIPVSDGTEKEFAIMDTFTVEEKHYMAVSLICLLYTSPSPRDTR